MRAKAWKLVLLLLFIVCVHARRAPPHDPVHGNLNEAASKLSYKIEQYEELKTAKHRRNLVIYHLGKPNVEHSGLDVSTNNIKMFVSALMTHLDGSKQEAFYLFNVADGKDNPLREYLPKRHPNVGVIDWHHVNVENDLSMRTLKLLGLDVLNSFGAVFFTSNDVRGPLVHRRAGQWLEEYRKLLDNNNVGMVGPVINCENNPHVSTYMYAWRTSLFNLLWDTENPQEQLGNSDFVRSSGYNISSMLYARKYRSPYFNGKCALGTGSKLQPTLNPVTWCTILPRDVLFMYWGGEAVRSLGYMCSHTQAMMRDALATISEKHPDMGLIVPETLVGGRLYEMYKEYSEELYMDRVRPKAQPGLNTTLPSEEEVAQDEATKRHKSGFSLFGSSEASKRTGIHTVPFVDEVCFAIRTAFMHDSSEEIQSQNMFEDVDIDGFIQCELFVFIIIVVSCLTTEV